ncbi:MAG: hypothetical protein RJA49_38, partial [Actinomycetota bacterium]
MNLEHFARTMVRRRRWVVLTWALLLAAVSMAAAAWGGDHRVDYSIPGSDSAAANEFLHERIPALAGDTARLLFIAHDGVASPGASAAIDAARRDASQIAHVVQVGEPTTSADGTISLVLVQFDATSEHLPLHVGEQLIELAERTDTPEVAVEAGGAVVQ